MPKKEIKTIRGTAASELEEKLLGFRTELAKERAVVASGTRPEKPGNIRKLRKNIARILTIKNEKKPAKAEKTGKPVEKKAAKKEVSKQK